jgi:hypothetical protein
VPDVREAGPGPADAQCAEGWHRIDELPEVDLELDDEDTDDADVSGRVVRSTRRRGDASDLPVRPIEARTVGRSFTAPDGKVHRPSMFITLTLPSYGRIIRGQGVPVDPARYDYRRAALDAMHFAKLVDRWVQNLRRGAGFKVQYFAAIEPQRRLAPHVHVAMRGRHRAPGHPGRDARDVLSAVVAPLRRAPVCAPVPGVYRRRLPRPGHPPRAEDLGGRPG